MRFVAIFWVSLVFGLRFNFSQQFPQVKTHGRTWKQLCKYMFLIHMSLGVLVFGLFLNKKQQPLYGKYTPGALFTGYDYSVPCFF